LIPGSVVFAKDYWTNSKNTTPGAHFITTNIDACNDDVTHTKYIVQYRIHLGLSP